MFDIQTEGNYQTIDLRPIILEGKHPRHAVFEHIKACENGTTFELHTPRLPKPLIRGLEDMGLHVSVEELAPDHFRMITTKEA